MAPGDRAGERRKGENDTRLLSVVAVSALLLAPAVLPAQTLSRSERKERIRKLPDQYRQFLLDVEPIIQPREETAFLTLDSDAQRDVFIAAFWKLHAPPGISG